MIIQTRMQEHQLDGRPVLIKREDMNPYGSHKIHGFRNYREWLVKTGRLARSRTSILLGSSSGRFIEAAAKATEGDNVVIRLVTDVLSSPALVESLSRFKHVIVDRPLINNPDSTGSHLPARLDRIGRLARELRGSLFMDQYADPLFADGYRKYLLPQILDQAGGAIGGLFAPGGTGGLINRPASFRRMVGGTWPIFAVDAEGSALLRTPPVGVKRQLPGYGNGIRTALIAEVSEEIIPVWVPDADAVAACHRLKNEGLWVGPSSGATAAAFSQVLRDHPRLLETGRPVVLIFPDAGDAYGSTVYDPLWLLKNGFNITAPRRHSA